MKKRTQSPAVLLTAISCIFSSTIATAFTIGFETAEGYTDASGGAVALNGNPGSSSLPSWSASSGKAQIVDVGGNQAGQFLAPGSSLGSFKQNYYTVTNHATEIFGVGVIEDDINADPTTAGYLGRVQVSMDVAMLTSGAGGGGSSAVFIRAGTDDAELFIQTDNTMQFRSDGQTYDILNADTSDFDYDDFGLNSYLSIDFDLDYGTQTYQLMVNGVQQDIAGNADIPFRTTSQTGNSFDRVHFQNNVDATLAGYRQIRFDNISMDMVAIPEPASIILFSAGLGITFLLGRRRNRG